VWCLVTLIDETDNSRRGFIFKLDNPKYIHNSRIIQHDNSIVLTIGNLDDYRDNGIRNLVRKFKNKYPNTPLRKFNFNYETLTFSNRNLQTTLFDSICI
jgi:hypothetical protein